MANREQAGAEQSRRQVSSPLGGNPEPQSVEDVARITMTSLLETGRYRRATSDWRGSDLRRFARYVAAEFGITRAADVNGEHVVAFMEAPSRAGSKPSEGTKRVRIFAIRAMAHEAIRLGLLEHDPTLGIQPPQHELLGTRPLTDEEIELGRARAVPSPRDRRRSLAWALSETTGRTGEIGLIRARDVDTDRGRVWLPGTPTVDARWGWLTPWALTQVKRRLAEIADPYEPLIVWRTKPRTLRAACSQAITETLHAAGLLAPDIRPRSITAWVGVKALESGASIDEVARRLGMHSLGQTVELVAFRWRDEAPT